MAPKIKKLQEKYGITDEDLKFFGLIRSPMLSGRVLETEKKKFIQICKRKKSTQSEEIRKMLDERIHKEINWDSIKIMKGESLKGLKTVPVRIKVSEKIEEEVIKSCEKNKVTISSFIRFLVVSYINKNEVLR